MCPFIDCNLDDIPDEVPQLTPGVHLLEVTAVDEEKGENGTTIKITYECKDEEGEDAGRKAWDRFQLWNEFALVKWGKFIKATGNSKSGKGIDTAELVGKIVKATVASRTYKDKDTDEMKVSVNIKEYHKAA